MFNPEFGLKQRKPEDSNSGLPKRREPEVPGQRRHPGISFNETSGWNPSQDEGREIHAPQPSDDDFRHRPEKDPKPDQEGFDITDPYGQNQEPSPHRIEIDLS